MAGAGAEAEIVSGPGMGTGTVMEMGTGTGTGMGIGTGTVMGTGAGAGRARSALAAVLAQPGPHPPPGAASSRRRTSREPLSCTTPSATARSPCQVRHREEGPPGWARCRRGTELHRQCSRLTLSCLPIASSKVLRHEDDGAHQLLLVRTGGTAGLAAQQQR